MKKILVAVDLMDETVNLIKKAKEIVKALDGELCVVHSESIENYLASDEFNSYPSMELPHMIEIRKNSIKERLDEINKDIKKDGIKSQCVLMDGTTVDNILEEAEKFKADIIMLGSHKHGRFYHLLFGSVHDMLIKKSDIPLIIVPPTKDKK